jgi:hypothetical protein
MTGIVIDTTGDELCVAFEIVTQRAEIYPLVLLHAGYRGW